MTSETLTVDLRDGSTPIGTEYVGRLLLIDRFDALSAHRVKYEALAQAARLGHAVIVVVITTSGVATPAKLWVPDAVLESASAVLGVPDLAVPGVIDALQDGALFDRLVELVPSLPVRVVAFTGAAGLPALLVPSAGPALPNAESQLWAVVTEGAPTAEFVMPGGRLDVAHRQVVEARATVEALAGAVGRVRELVRRDRPTARIGPATTALNGAVEGFHAVLNRLVQQLDGRLRFGIPTTGTLIEFGLAPAPPPRADLVAAVHELVGGLLPAATSLTAVSRDLRRAAVALWSDGCASTVDRLAAVDSPALTMPRFPRQPMPLAALALVFLTSAVAAVLPGRGPLTATVAVAAVGGWLSTAWLACARRPMPTGETGTTAGLAPALGTVGVVAVLGAVTGLLLLSGLVATPLPGFVGAGVALALAFLAMLLAVTVGWKRTARRWQASWSLAESRASVEEMNAIAMTVLQAEWPLVDRRDVVADAANEFAACLDEAATLTGAEPPTPEVREILDELLKAASAASTAGRRAELGHYRRLLVRARIARDLRGGGLVPVALAAMPLSSESDEVPTPSVGSRSSTGFRDEYGVRHRTDLILGPPVDDPHGRMPARRVVDTAGRQLVLRYLPAGLPNRAAVFAELDAEIRALARLRRVFRDRYPAELPELVGYDVHTSEPFVLLGNCLGPPATAFVGRLTLREHYAFRCSLVRALAHLSAARLVHGAIGLSALTWDGSTVTVLDFRTARPFDEADSDCGHDLVGAGCAMRDMLFGSAAHAAADDPAPLCALLAGVFDEASQRPLPADLARRLRSPAALVRAIHPEESLAPGRIVFRAATQADGPALSGPARRRVGSLAGWMLWPRPHRRVGITSPPDLLRLVRCPVCLDAFVWSEPDVLSFLTADTREPDDVDISDVPADRRAAMLAEGFVRCPNPHADTQEHYLAATYGAFSEPLVVAVVGMTGAGKSALIATIIDELTRDTAPSAYGVTATLLGRDLNAYPGLPACPPHARTVVLQGPAQRLQPLTFVELSEADVAGLGNPHSPGRATRVLHHAQAFLFVAEPCHLRGTTDEAGLARENPVFARVLDELAVSGGGHDRPAAVALTKCEALRYVPPLDRWLGERERPESDSEESDDVFAYLYSVGQTAETTPYRAFRRCTLHATTAGVGPSPPDGRRVRVVGPALSIVAARAFGR
jgi:hypothetical protein